MNRLGLMVILIAATSAVAQNQPDINTLYLQLTQSQTSDTATRQILELASKDSTARDFVAQRLPTIIAGQAPVTVWANAVQLTGKLKLSNAIPVLKEAFARGPIPNPANHGFRTLSDFANLGQDIVGKALAEMGDASVPAVTEILASPDKSMRARAVWVLINIDSPAARNAMRDDLQHESDPTVSALIRKQLNIQ